jgi:hypothetical protein
MKHRHGLARLCKQHGAFKAESNRCSVNRSQAVNQLVHSLSWIHSHDRFSLEKRTRCVRGAVWPAFPCLNLDVHRLARCWEPDCEALLGRQAYSTMWWRRRHDSSRVVCWWPCLSGATGRDWHLGPCLLARRGRRRVTLSHTQITHVELIVSHGTDSYSKGTGILCREKAVFLFCRSRGLSAEHAAQ